MTTPPLVLAERHAADYAGIEFHSMGAQAEVYSAQYKALRRPERVAIKVLRPDSAPGKSAEEMRARFLAEAEALRSVSHPHVVRVFEIVEARLRGEPTLGFVMEWLETTFSAHVRQAPAGLAEPQLCRCFEAALKGLGALHEAGIAVRDLRPDNLLLNARGQLKLADLGMARTETAVLSIREQSTQYQAPEVLDGSLRRSYETLAAGSLADPKHEADPSASAYFGADLYSLGLVFYEAAVGADRWRSLSALGSIFGKNGPGSDLPMDKRWENWHTNRGLELPPVGAVRRDIPEAVGRAIDGMVKKDPAKRLSRVEGALAVLDARGGPSRPFQGADLPAAATAPRVSESRQSGQAGRAFVDAPSAGRRWLGRIFWIGGAIFLGVIAAIWWWRGGHQGRADLLVVTEPEHAILVVDGREAGSTPTTITDCRYGRTYELTVRLAGYEMLRESVTVDSQIDTTYRMARASHPRVALFSSRRQIESQVALMYFQMGMQLPPPQEQYARLRELLQQERCEVVPVELTAASPVPDDADLLVIMAVAPLLERQAWEVNRVLTAGIPVVLALQAHEYGYSPTPPGGWSVHGRDIATGLEPMLASFGLTVSEDHFMDSAMEVIKLLRKMNLGGRPVETREPVRMPIQIRITESQMNAASPVVHGIAALFYLWGTPIDVNAAKLATAGLECTTLMSSSANCWRLRWHEGQVTSAMVNPAGHAMAGPQPLAVLVEGMFPDTWAGRPVPLGLDGESATPTPMRARTGRLLLLGSAKMFDDYVIDAMENRKLLTNAVKNFSSATVRVSVPSKKPAYTVSSPATGVRVPGATSDLPAAPTHHVTDVADVLTASEEAVLNKRLLALEVGNITQMVIYIGTTLNGRRLSDFCLRTFNAWRVGDAKRNNGLAVFVFIDDRVVRIQVGRGLEEVMSNEFCEAAIQECLLPNFRERRYAFALNELVDRITRRLQDAAGGS